MKKMNNKGFSLVELIIVIAIMAILIGVLAPQYLKYVEKSRVSSDKDQLDSIYTACTTAASDADITDAPSAASDATEPVSVELDNTREWGKEVLDTLGLAGETDSSSLKWKSKAAKGDAADDATLEVEVFVDANGNFSVEIGDLSVPEKDEEEE